jgi:hypothetical protein
MQTFDGIDAAPERMEKIPAVLCLARISPFF